MRLTNLQNLPLILSAVTFLCACSSQDNWIEVGDGPQDLKAIPYRLIDVIGKEKLPPTHQDLLALTLALQSGKANRSWVYIPLFECYAPKVRSGLPTVQCVSGNGNANDVYIAATDNVREILLSLKNDRKRAAVKGQAVGLYADTPIIYVSDVAAKRNSE